MVDKIRQLIDTFEPISLAGIDAVKLMTRTDQKYVCRTDQLPAVLEAARPHFRVLDINKVRLQGYESLYLDTPDHEMYIMHHNGHLNRYKIRIREYQESHKFFLEIKFKDNHGKTTKKRISIGPDRNYLSPDITGFIEAHSIYTPETLQPILSSSFKRITLVSNVLQERITIDLNPAWFMDSKKITLPGLVILEVKSTRNSSTRGFGYLLREARIHPCRISKYCTGTNLLYPEIKHNRFKAKILYLAKLDKIVAYA
ncbi:MAG: polyphosphate polymerase domain-containing protein [Bacteroidota bacterium]